jgi:FtsH-binding integral membrane protein
MLQLICSHLLALNLYVDIINLFLDLLKILRYLNEDRKKDKKRE